MSKKKDIHEREIYDIPKLKSYISKNSTESDPEDYTSDKMAVFGANVNLRRQILEIKDGLKPVHRRVLMVMHEQRLFNGKTSKSAQVVGDIVKKYHPHSPEACYGSIINLGQSWRNNVQLVNPGGSFGSAFKPDGYAAYRYTNCGLSDFAYDCFFKDWKYTNPKEDMTVDWTPTYDDSDLEPIYLPAKYPLFLLNWHRAMGVGRYTSTVGFNLTDAFNAVIKLIENPDAKFTIYPDDPQGCDIINGHELKNLLDATDVKVKVRATYSINHYDGKDVIEITNAPFEVSPDSVVRSIVELADKGYLPEISDINGCSVYPGDMFKISIDVKKGYDPHAIMNKLYRRTQLQQTYAMTYAFVDSLESVNYTLRIAILEWVRHRKQTISRIYKIRRVYILTRIHFLEPLIKVMESGDIDTFISIIKNNTYEESIPKIMAKFKLTDYQAQKIADVKISALSLDKLKEYKKELAECLEEDERLDKIIKSSKEIEKIIISELKEGIEKYGTSRKSKVVMMLDSLYVPDTLHYLIFTNKYIKKLPYDEKGYRIGKLENGDSVVKVMSLSNKENIAVFTADGKCLITPLNDIGNSSLQSLGIAYSQIGCKDNRFVDAFVVDESIPETKYIVSLTKNGLIRKIKYSDILDKTGKVFPFMKVPDDDRMTAVTLADEDDEILVYTNNGYGAVFGLDTFECTQLNTKGVQSAKLDEGVDAIGLTPIKSIDRYLLTLSNRGYMKKFSISNMPNTKRNDKLIEICNGNGDVVKVKALNENIEAVYVYTNIGAFELDPDKIKVSSRIAKSSRVIELKSNEYAFDIN